jgi:hypothetical protein
MDELRPGNPIVAGERTIVPIERCLFQSVAGKSGCWLSGLKEPVAVIISDSSGMRAFDPEGGEIPVVSLIRKVPGLCAVVRHLPRSDGE